MNGIVLGILFPLSFTMTPPIYNYIQCGQNKFSMTMKANKIIFITAKSLGLGYRKKRLLSAPAPLDHDSWHCWRHSRLCLELCYLGALVPSLPIVDRQALFEGRQHFRSIRSLGI